jgi:hypothetical protein
MGQNISKDEGVQLETFKIQHLTSNIQKMQIAKCGVPER